MATGNYSSTTSNPSSENRPQFYISGIAVASVVIVCIVVGTIVHTKKVRKQRGISPKKPLKQRRRRSASSRKKNSKATYGVSLAGFDRAWAGRPREEPNQGQYIFDDSSSGYLSLQGSEAYHNCTHEDFARWSDSVSFQNDVDGYLMPGSDYYCIYVNVANLLGESTHEAPAAFEEAVPETIVPKSTSTRLTVHPPLPSRLSIDTDGEETEESEESDDGIEYSVTPFCLEPSRIRANTNPQALTNPRLCKVLKELSDNHDYITAL